MDQHSLETTISRFIQNQTVPEDQCKVFEDSLTNLAKIYLAQNKLDIIKQLLLSIMPLLNSVSKARGAKIIRILIDEVGKQSKTELTQIEMCQILIDWCDQQGKSYLKHRVQIRLAGLYILTQDFAKAQLILTPLQTILKKFDDKHLLVELFLTETKLHLETNNHSKAKAALTASRANANQIYCPPSLQGEIDVLAGVVYTLEKEFKIAYSYFFEAFEAYVAFDQPKALNSLKYMVISKIMTKNHDEVNQILTSKNGIKFSSPDLISLKQVNEAYSKKLLFEFKEIIEQFSEDLKKDSVIVKNIKNIYEELVEQSIFKIIQPYSRVQIDYVGSRLQMNINDITFKLSELILDKKLDATIDQSKGCLILFDNQKSVCQLQQNSLEALKSVNGALDSIQTRVKAIKIQ